MSIHLRGGFFFPEPWIEERSVVFVYQALIAGVLTKLRPSTVHSRTLDS
jgi:hypothetical protein